MNTTSKTLSGAEQRALMMLGQRVRQLRRQHGMSIVFVAYAIVGRRSRKHTLIFQRGR
jgi:hypothetical protein